MTKNQSKAFWCPILIGIILVVVGLSIQMPGGALTTYASLNGESTDYYEFDNRYSTIDEYVGGDAYNFIIGASLVAGKISGTMTVKALCVVAGTLCSCFGITLMMLMKEDSPAEELNKTLRGILQNLSENTTQNPQDSIPSENKEAMHSDVASL